MLTLNDVYVILAGAILNSRTTSNSQISSMKNNMFESLQESQPSKSEQKVSRQCCKQLRETFVEFVYHV